MNRQVQIYKDQQWIDIHMEDIREFDTFRVLNENGEPIIDAKGRKFFIAASNPYKKLDDTVVDVC